VRWSLQNADAKTNGWIIQKVTYASAVTDASDNSVVPTKDNKYGLAPEWYPLWEAWQVRGGQIFTGRSSDPHKRDKFAAGSFPARTAGSMTVAGRANFYPNLTLPESFVETMEEPTVMLPTTKVDPQIPGGTRWLDHIATTSWNSIKGSGTTTLTKV
jgi:hypothetical protein